MGDLLARVELTGVTDIDSNAVGPTFSANGLIDSGAQRSVISTSIASQLGCRVIPKKILFERKLRDVAFVFVRVKDRGCVAAMVGVVVDDALAKRIGLGEETWRGSGKALHVLVGSDYLQTMRMALYFNDEHDKQALRCGTTPPRRKPAVRAARRK